MGTFDSNFFKKIKEGLKGKNSQANNESSMVKKSVEFKDATKINWDTSDAHIETDEQKALEDAERQLKK